MSVAKSIPGVAWAVLAFAAWSSRDLVEAWRHSPLDRLGWLAFAVWLAPALISSLQGPQRPWSPLGGSLLGVGVLALVVGAAADVRAANYAALALAISAVARPMGPTFGFWLFAALSWMPALTWAAKALTAPGLITLRLLLPAVSWAVIHRPLRVR